MHKTWGLLPLLAANVLFLHGCVENAQADVNYSDPSSSGTLQPYGVEGDMTWEQVNTLQNLKFPQTYDAISSTFGYPAWRDSENDWYVMPDGKYATVFYNSDGLAVGFEIQR